MEFETITMLLNHINSLKYEYLYLRTRLDPLYIKMRVFLNQLNSIHQFKTRFGLSCD